MIYGLLPRKDFQREIVILKNKLLGVDSVRGIDVLYLIFKYLNYEKNNCFSNHYRIVNCWLWS